MAVERNHAIAFIFVLGHFLIGSKNGEELLGQFKYQRLLNKEIIFVSEKNK